MKQKIVQTICLIVPALVLMSGTPLSKERPAVETAYTQDACNCVRGHVRDQDNRPVLAARVSLWAEKTLTPVALVFTDNKGDFSFRSIPLNEDLMLAVEAEGFVKATVASFKVRPSYSLVTTVRLTRK